MKRRMFIDMDGTLAVFTPVDTMETLYEKGYFAKLEPHQLVIDGLRLYMSQEPDTELYILSSTLEDSLYAEDEKNEWLDEHFPEMDAQHRIFPPCGKEKADYVPGGIGENDYILDDYTLNLNQWEAAGGKGIKLRNAINGQKGTWKGRYVTYMDTPKDFVFNLKIAMGDFKSHYAADDKGFELTESDIYFDEEIIVMDDEHGKMCINGSLAVGFDVDRYFGTSDENGYYNLYVNYYKDGDVKGEMTRISETVEYELSATVEFTENEKRLLWKALEKELMKTAETAEKFFLEAEEKEWFDDYEVTEAETKVYVSAVKELKEKMLEEKTSQFDGARTIGKAVSDEYIVEGGIGFVGRKIVSADNIAELMQCYRNPLYETMRGFYIKDDKLIFAEGITNKLPGNVILSFPEQKNFVSHVNNNMERLGADKFYMLHNHPSGNPKPSVNDPLHTRLVADEIKGFEGHIVLNHTKYSLIDKDGNYEILDVPNALEKDVFITASVRHPLLNLKVEGSEQIADIGRKLIGWENTDVSCLVYVDSERKIRMIQELSNSVIEYNSEFCDYLQTQLISAGSVGAIVFTSLEELYDKTEPLIKQGYLSDAVYMDPDFPFYWSKRDNGIKKDEEYIFAGITFDNVKTYSYETDIKTAEQMNHEALDDVYQVMHYTEQEAGSVDDFEEYEPQKMSAESLPAGWIWHQWYDGSGCLKAPDGKKYFEYDIHPISKEIEYRETSKHLYGFLNKDLSEFKKFAEQIISEKYINSESRKKCNQNKTEIEI